METALLLRACITHIRGFIAETETYLQSEAFDERQAFGNYKLDAETSCWGRTTRNKHVLYTTARGDGGGRSNGSGYGGHPQGLEAH